MNSISRAVGSRPNRSSQPSASRRSFASTCRVRVENASFHSCVTPSISLPIPSARRAHSTPNSRVSADSTYAATTADMPPRWPRIRIVSSARHFPSASVSAIRAHRLWL